MFESKNSCVCSLGINKIPETNLKLSIYDDGNVVDSTLCKQIVGCMRYACNSKSDICHNVNFDEKIYVET